MAMLELADIPTIDTIVADLVDIIRRHTKSAGSDWGAATGLEEAGIDSFDFVELIFEIEDKYKINVNFNANTSTETLLTVGDVARFVQTAIRSQRPQ